VIWILVVVGVLVILGLALVVSYNRFVAQRQLVRNAWANIDTELRRRYDLIPNLVETVKGYASHEREVFEEVTRARSAAMAATGSPEQQAAAEGPLVEALRRLFAVAENYPDLKASQNFLALQGELSNTEDRIQASRRFYNANVQEYNRRIHAFPSNLIAGMFGFHEEQFFEIEEALRPTLEQAPRVNFGAAAPGPAEPPPTPAPAAAPPPVAQPLPEPPPPSEPGGGPPEPPPSNPAPPVPGS
jgi:LemA protein